MAIDDKSQRKKSIAFKEDAGEGDDQLEGDTDENLIGSISLLSKSFSKAMRRLDKRTRKKVMRKLYWINFLSS